MADAKTEVMQQVRQQAAISNARALVEVRERNQLPLSPKPTNIVESPLFKMLHSDDFFLAQKLNEHCFERCVPTPGSSLSSGEQTCYTNCMEKYMAAWNATSKQYLSHVQKGM